MSPFLSRRHFVRLSAAAAVAGAACPTETREHVVEDEIFGNHAAMACHMANHSYFHRGVATWDESSRSIKS